MAPVGIPAAERAAKIFTACIPWVSEKQYLTMLAAGQVFSQVGLFFEDGSNNLIIARSNTANRFLPVPVRNELKTEL